jgi:hypothetical protein
VTRLSGVCRKSFRVLGNCAEKVMADRLLSATSMN